MVAISAIFLWLVQYNSKFVVIAGLSLAIYNHTLPQIQSKRYGTLCMKYNKNGIRRIAEFYCIYIALIGVHS